MFETARKLLHPHDSDLHYVRFMWFIAIVLILIGMISGFDLFVGISDLTHSLNNLCLKFTPESFYHEIYSALVCGKNLSDKNFSQNLKNLGIYHVIVVSGSHLIFLSVMLEKATWSERWPKLKLIIAPLLTIYTLMVGTEPPVVRALLSLAVSAFQTRAKLFWNQNEVIFISLLLCLVLFEPWKISYSLLLSYVASVSLTIPQKSSFIKKNLWIYILILPFLLPLSAPQPLSILANITLTPILSFVLFPLSFAAYIIPYFSIFTDQLWKLFLLICALIGPELSTIDTYPIHMNALWALAISLNFYGIYKEKLKW